ncbi:DUF4145 domain-containing protein [Natronorubrum sp. DTA7]|uniref:DUF4145 domain-containing protein n=1 Tax=Natronorubrum sp. DTA7 TaxID=3447016 RepID=UPI003F84954F
MASDYTPPEFGESKFNCPHCGTYAHHSWDRMAFNNYTTSFFMSKCVSCDDNTIWKKSQNPTMYYPKSSSAPLPHNQMPKDVRRDYVEAREIVNDSPRAAAALLRLAIQRLLENHLETPGDGIFHDIGYLVEENEIHPTVRKMLDAVRITGNNSVHPGEMNMDDDSETAIALFKLINYIVDGTIGREKEVEEFWNTLPEEEKEWVEDRDK